MMKLKLIAGVIGAALLASATPARAAVSAEEAKALGTTLTFVGAEKAANKDGTIPEYTGGLTTPPPAYVKGSPVRPDPFADEKPVFSIDAKNVAQYEDKLTEGAKALLKTYPGFRIEVFPTHRTVAYPKNVLDNAVKNATRATASADGLALRGSRAGIPFPIPKNGTEAMWNGMTAFQGLQVQCPRYTAYNVTSSGRATVSTQGAYVMEYLYYDETRSDNLFSRGRAYYSGPARRAGEAVQTSRVMDYSAQDARNYTYLPGQRRVRLAPELTYDTPNASTSGMSTIDDISLFNGPLDRFAWRLVGKKELFIPYNTYRFTYNAKPEDVFQAKFINPAVLRWELHRVWVVEGKLKDGKRHVYSRRTYYLDEDSWAFAAVDEYDGRGQLWRVGFNYLSANYDALTVSNFTYGHYDLIAGAYNINFWPGAHGVKVSNRMESDSFWSPDNLAASGVR